MKSRNLLIVFIIIYAGSFIYILNRALDLEFNGELIALLPSENDHLASYKKLENLNSSEGGFNLIIHSLNDEPVIESARAITDRILELTNDEKAIFRSAEMENDLYDIRNSALYLMTEDELSRLYTEVEDYINQKKKEANPFYVDFEEEEEAVLEISSNASVLLDDVANARRYSVNEDSTVISILFLPDFSKSDYNQVEQTYRLLEQTKANIEAENPELELYWGGSYVNHYDKINDVKYSVTKALVIGILSLLIFLVGYMVFINRKTGYRAAYIFIDLVLFFFVLFSGFVISIGLSSFLFNEINVFTGIIFSILFGINLDYILHLYSVNKERLMDTSSIMSVIRSYLSSTKPILLSCLTTGLAIMSLIFAKFEGFIQFGIIFFINIIVNLLSTYLFLLLSPSMAKKDQVSSDTPARKSSILSNINQKLRLIGIPVFLMITVFGTYVGSQSISFNFNFSDLEPKSKSNPYKELNSETSTGSSYNDPAYFIADNVAESKELFKEIRNGIGDKYKDIESVESFSARFPTSDEELDMKTSKVDSIKQLLNRNEEFLTTANSDVIEFVEIAKNTVIPTLDGLPKYIKNRFFFRDGSLAPLVVMYPAMSLSNGQTSIKFRKNYGAISIDSGKTFYAASTFIIASSILELLIEESSFLFIVPLLTIIVLLLIYYRSFLKAFLAATPLLLTFGMLLSIRAFIPFDINLYNLIVFPIIIGVGADTGIHLVDSLINHREDFLSYFVSVKFPVLASCSITTILGFIGLLFINHPGMESIGILAITGITTTLLATYLTSLVVHTFILKK